LYFKIIIVSLFIFVFLNVNSVCFVQIIQDETAVIFTSLRKQASSHEEDMTAFEAGVLFLREAAVGDPLIAKQVIRQIDQATAMITAMQQRPAIPEFPPAVLEPANKNIAPQRFFRNTKLSRKRAPELSLKKPSATEKKHLLEALDGNLQLVSQDGLQFDHSYVINGDELGLFEHSYCKNSNTK